MPAPLAWPGYADRTASAVVVALSPDAYLEWSPQLAFRQAVWLLERTVRSATSRWKGAQWERGSPLPLELQSARLSAPLVAVERAPSTPASTPPALPGKF